MDQSINRLAVGSEKRAWLELTEDQRKEQVQLGFLFLPQERIRSMQSLFEKFNAVLQTANLKFVVTYGTLLGVKRDPVSCPMPWVDDIDVVADLGERDKVIDACTAHFNVQLETVGEFQVPVPERCDAFLKKLYGKDWKDCLPTSSFRI